MYLTPSLIDKDLRSSMDLWAPINSDKTEIKDSSEYLTSNYLISNLIKNWSVIYRSSKIQNPKLAVPFISLIFHF